MPYVPGFSYDLFISYASEDNLDGWVEKFQKQLTDELARLLGRPFSDKSVFFDKIRLEVGQAYPEILDQAARESAALVVVLSPSSSNSVWCSREREAFQDQLVPRASLAESLAVCRIRPTGALPKLLSDAQRADFVITEREEPWPAGSSKWLEVVNSLAVQIKHMLQRLRSRAGGVFVGSPLRSNMALRDDLADYLAKQHFRATPEPASLLEDRAASRQALSEAVCGVHFVGHCSQRVLDCIEDSITFCPGPTVLFQPFGAEMSAEEDLLLLNLPAEKYPHKLGPNVVELNKFLEELLTRRPESTISAASLGLICDVGDIPWAQEFKASDLSVEYPRFLQDKLSNQEQIQKWRQLLKSSHGLLFYHGRSAERLLHTLAKLADQEQSAAVRRWYLAEPDVEAKRQTRMNDPIYPDGLDKFLEEVRGKAKSAGK
jgi:hypothetical protein